MIANDGHIALFESKKEEIQEEIDKWMIANDGHIALFESKKEEIQKKITIPADVDATDSELTDAMLQMNAAVAR